VTEGARLTLEFGMGGNVSGSGGVNKFNGPYESTQKTLDIGTLAGTSMAGPPELMEQEAAYLAALENAATWEVTGGKLTVRDASGATQITASTSTP